MSSDVENPEPEASNDAPRTMPPPRAPRTIAFLAVRAGAGSSTLVANLGVYLASVGRKVTVVDADPAGGSLALSLGLGCHLPSASMLETSVSGLSLFHPGMDEAPRDAVRLCRWNALPSRVAELQTAYRLIDVGQGLAPAALDYVQTCTSCVYVVSADPPSMTSFFRLLRHAFARHVRKHAASLRERGELAAELRATGAPPSPLALAARLRAKGSPLAEAVDRARKTFVPKVVVSKVRGRSDLELGDSLRTFASRALGLRVEHLGYIDYDDAVDGAIRAGRPLLVESPGTKAARSIERIARRLIASDETPRQETVPHDSLHGLLEVDRGATDEDVRRAHRRMKDLFSLSSIIATSLYPEPELEAIRRRLDEAYEVMLDPARRRAYEMSVFAAEFAPPEATSVPVSAADRPPLPLLDPTTEITGEVLRAARESHGLDIKDLAHKTKISLAYLRALEDENFAALPAEVYVRGFVTEVARTLRLDSLLASRGYLRRMNAFLEEARRRGP